MSAKPAPTAYVVDDDESIRSLWQWLLGSNGIAVQTFATATAFIEAYRRGDAGCLVLDVRLPGMDGLAATALLTAAMALCLRVRMSSSTGWCSLRREM